MESQMSAFAASQAAQRGRRREPRPKRISGGSHHLMISGSLLVAGQLRSRVRKWLQRMKRQMSAHQEDPSRLQRQVSGHRRHQMLSQRNLPAEGRERGRRQNCLQKTKRQHQMSAHREDPRRLQRLRRQVSGHRRHQMLSQRNLPAEGRERGRRQNCLQKTKRQHQMSAHREDPRRQESFRRPVRGDRRHQMLSQRNLPAEG